MADTGGAGRLCPLDTAPTLGWAASEGLGRESLQIIPSLLPHYYFGYEGLRKIPPTRFAAHLPFMPYGCLCPMGIAREAWLRSYLGGWRHIGWLPPDSLRLWFYLALLEAPLRHGFAMPPLLYPWKGPQV